MGRKIAGVVVGYIIMFVICVVVYFGAYFAMGPDRAFKPASFEPSTMWLALMAGMSLVAAILGGWVCAMIAKSAGAARALALVVLVLGLLMAIPTFTGVPSTEPRPAEMSGTEAMMKAETPSWIAVVNPILGAIGVMIGASLFKPRHAAGE
jgi:hypothetical protein